MSDVEDIDMLRTTIVESLKREGCPPVVAELAAQRVISDLQSARGATRIYIASTRQQREKQILQEWRGSDGSKESIRKIADQHDVTPRTVYNVIKRVRQKKQQNHDANPSSSEFGSEGWCL